MIGELESIELSDRLSFFWSEARDVLVLVLIDKPIVGLSVGLTFVLIVELIVGRSFGLESIELSDRLSFSWSEARGVLIFVLIGGLIGGPIGGLIGGLIFVLTFGLISVLISGLSFGLSFGLVGSEIEQKVYLNQGIWNSLRIGLSRALIVGLSFGLIGGLSFGLIGGLIFGLSVGLIGGLPQELGSCLKHAVLRQILHSNGFIPWNYARFLDHCTDRLLLQRVGGRVRFIHKTVQEHFAQIEFERP